MILEPEPGNPDEVERALNPGVVHGRNASAIFSSG
jgi:hypothetical protein